MFKKGDKMTKDQPAATPVVDPNIEKIQELTNDLQRTRADFENYRKQIEIQKANEKNAAKLATIYNILPLLDDIDRAIATYPELQPLAKSLEKTLKELNLAKIPAEPGTDFNPDFHDAIMMDDSEGEKEIIAEVLRPGYQYQGEILRPAMVKVGHSTPVNESK